MSGQHHAPAALPPGKGPVTHCLGGWVVPRSGLDGYSKSLLPSGFDPRIVQPVARRYTDCAIPARIIPVWSWKSSTINSNKMYNYSEILTEIQVHFCYPQRFIVTILRAVRPTNRGSIRGSCKTYFLHSIQAESGTHTASSRQYVRGFLSRGWSGRFLKLTSHLHVVTRLRKNDATLILLTLRHGVNWTNLKAAYSIPQVSLIKSILFTAYFYP